MPPFTDEQRQKFLSAWADTGAKLLEDPRLVPDDLERMAAIGLPRVLSFLPGTSIGVATPCRDTVQEETHRAIINLAFNFGMCPRTAQGFEVANNREALLDAFIDAGYRRLLFLDSDTVVEARGVWQLVETMDRWRASMVAALVPQRLLGAVGQYNAFLDAGGDQVVTVTKEHVPQSLTAFPVKYVGLACALLDLEQIRAKPGPRFKRLAVGHKHVGEDISFCEWLQTNELDFYVDPKVPTVHITNHRLGYQPPQPEKAE